MGITYTDSRFLSCDWGTSRFRLRLADSAGLSAVGEIETPDGISSVSKLCEQRCSTDRMDIFLEVLKEAVGRLAAAAGQVLDDLPIVISGMAASSIGIKELPYARLPFAADGSGVQAAWLEQRTLPNPVLLVSGVAGKREVMRGEETQLIGLYSQAGCMPEKDYYFIFPGTHSKHLLVTDGRIRQIRTFMTGELFALLSRDSILAQSTGYGERPLPSDMQATLFKEGIDDAGEGNFLQLLFSVRARQLTEGLTPAEGYFYLSGLLIGAELKDVPFLEGCTYLVCGTSVLNDLYRIALGSKGFGSQAIFFDDSITGSAAATGQAAILNLIKPAV